MDYQSSMGHYLSTRHIGTYSLRSQVVLALRRLGNPLISFCLIFFGEISGELGSSLAATEMQIPQPENPYSEAVVSLQMPLMLGWSSIGIGNQLFQQYRTAYC